MQNEPVAVSFRTLIELYLKNDFNNTSSTSSTEIPRFSEDPERTLREMRLAQTESELKIRTEVNAKVIADFLKS